MKDILLIGIDGGATKVSGWEIIYDEQAKTFQMGQLNSSKSYNEIPGFLPDFNPVPVQDQFAQRDEGSILPNDDELQQEAVYVEACAQVIEELCKNNPDRKILAGIGMPGLKTEDRRGIAIVANGPRMINYSDLLEKRLALKNIEFAAPVHHLGSDADYCGIGENYSAEGAFRTVQNAYYLGGGTGVADALKLNGELVPFDLTKDWLAKTWEMKSADGRSLERFTSVGGMQAVYAEISGRKVSELNEQNIYPLQIAELAEKGDAAAKEMTSLAAENLSLLLFERISSLYSGSQGVLEFVNPSRPQLNEEHPYLKNLFDCIIIGQRLGDLFEAESGKQVIRKPVMDKLSEMISNSDVLDAKAKQHYSNLDKIVITSSLREAPALGAGVDAFLTHKGF